MEYKRAKTDYNKSEIAEKIGIHINTYRKREINPLSFTLGELIQLKIALNAETIDDIFNLNKDGER